VCSAEWDCSARVLCAVQSEIAVHVYCVQCRVRLQYTCVVCSAEWDYSARVLCAVQSETAVHVCCVQCRVRLQCTCVVCSAEWDCSARVLCAMQSETEVHVCCVQCRVRLKMHGATIQICTGVCLGRYNNWTEAEQLGILPLSWTKERR